MEEEVTNTPDPRDIDSSKHGASLFTEGNASQDGGVGFILLACLPTSLSLPHSHRYHFPLRSKALMQPNCGLSHHTVS